MTWRYTLAVAALFFVAYLVFKLRGFSFLRPGRKRLSAAIARLHDARRRARGAASARERAEAFCDGARIAAEEARRFRAASGLFVRAMRADPVWPGAIAIASDTLTPRAPRLLERLLWTRLAELSWDRAHETRAVTDAVLSGLVTLYERGLRDRSKAQALRKLAEHLQLRSPERLG